jgi:flavin-dependent thymidylate synthase
MKVSLISHTPHAAELLIFTKSTRLNMSPGLMDEIMSWSEDKKLAELEYMAATIPSSWEFVDYVFMIEGVSRAFTHQFVRSRNASYAQQTMRVLDMGEYDYVMPDRVANNADAAGVVGLVNHQIRNAYRRLIQLGLPPEDARGILPTNIATNICAKFNLRALSELVASRTGGRTQGEYQRVAQAMADAVLAVHPWAAKFLFRQGRDYFAEIEAFAEAEYGGDLLKKGKLLKIVDAMRKDRQS